MSPPTDNPTSMRSSTRRSRRGPGWWTARRCTARRRPGLGAAIAQSACRCHRRDEGLDGLGGRTGAPTSRASSAGSVAGSTCSRSTTSSPGGPPRLVRTRARRGPGPLDRRDPLRVQRARRARAGDAHRAARRDPGPAQPARTRGESAGAAAGGRARPWRRRHASVRRGWLARPAVPGGAGGSRAVGLAGGAPPVVPRGRTGQRRDPGDRVRRARPCERCGGWMPPLDPDLRERIGRSAAG